MDVLKRNLKRIVTDATGYLLLLAALATGWLPGPGGIPLALAGLGLLSINNRWAKEVREYLLKNGGKIVQIMFPRNTIIEWLYDSLAVLLLLVTATLAWRHAAIWEISIATAVFFIALMIALLNRDRLNRFKSKHNR